MATETFIYHYTSGGSIIGMSYRNTSYAYGVFDTYIFEKNIFGDIVAVYDLNGNKLVSYKYDAWGNFEVAYHNGTTANSVAARNPFRYRSYYFDTDLALYYLNSRYYDAKTGRFINADSYVSTGQGILGNNMFAYCGNNPVCRYDVGGEIWENLIDAALHIGNTIAVSWGIDTAAIGAKFLMMEPDEYGVYHARVDCWQQYFGYNEFYDFVFDVGTDMDAQKFDFSYNGQDYTIWAWKGDYINLGAGAELGIYRNFGFHRFVDKSLAMKMKMYVCYDNKVIIQYEPEEKQWWITGFNPAYQNVMESDLDVRIWFYFNDYKMYKAFKAEWDTYSQLNFYDQLGMVILRF